MQRVSTAPYRHEHFHSITGDLLTCKMEDLCINDAAVKQTTVLAFWVLVAAEGGMQLGQRGNT